MDLEIKTTVEKYNVIAEEVRTFIKQYEPLLSQTDIYFGTQILYSPAVYKPKFMFIGINPGAGYFNSEKKNVEEFGEQDEFEYTDDNESYRLKNETNELFKLAGCHGELEDSVKTNCYFLATRKQKDLDILATMFYEHKINLHEMSAIWVRKIIEIIEPKIIICEGKSAYGRVTCNVLNCPSSPSDWENGVGYVHAKQNIHVIGYERSWSNIKYKEKVALKIEELNELVSRSS